MGRERQDKCGGLSTAQRTMKLFGASVEMTFFLGGAEMLPLYICAGYGLWSGKWISGFQVISIQALVLRWAPARYAGMRKRSYWVKNCACQ
jgi:hypothetical protein